MTLLLLILLLLLLFFTFDTIENDSTVLDSHITPEAETSWYPERMGEPNPVFTLFIIRFYPISSSLYITQEIPCRWLSFLPKAIVLDGSHPAHSVGYDYSPSP